MLVLSELVMAPLLDFAVGRAAAEDAPADEAPLVAMREGVDAGRVAPKLKPDIVCIELARHQHKTR